MYIIDKSAEVKLVQMLNEMGGDGEGWLATQFNLSELLDEYKSEYQVKIALNLLTDLLRGYDGSIFLCQDGAIIVLGYKIERSLLNKLIFQLRYFYMDDPLAYHADGQENPNFSVSYDLKADFKTFSEASNRRMMATRRKLEAKPEIVRKEEEVMPEGVSSALLSAMRLANIERDLTSMDISTVLRRQPVYAIAGNQAPKQVFEEVYIHIAQLRELLKAEVDLLSNKWLFKYLTSILDEKVIEMIQARLPDFLSRAISVNLNVESVLSSWFEAFSKTVKPELKKRIVLEIPLVDAFADIQAFEFARDMLQKQGFRLCLDGLNAGTFLHIEKGKMGADLVKLQWNAEAKVDIKSESNQRLSDSIKACGPGRVILCRCDTQGAIDYGRELGISLFQGRYLDSQVHPQAKVVN